MHSATVALRTHNARDVGCKLYSHTDELWQNGCTDREVRGGTGSKSQNTFPIRHTTRTVFVNSHVTVVLSKLFSL